LLEDDEGDVVLQFCNVVKLINGIQNIQTLYLTEDTLEVSFLLCSLWSIFERSIAKYLIRVFFFLFSGSYYVL
jgi:hypothetical protein